MNRTTQESKLMGRSWLLGFAVALLAAPAAWAQTQIRAINTSQQAGVEVVRIELSEPLPALPKGFTVQTPPRIAIDLPGVVNAIGRNLVEINQGNLKSANVAQAGDRSRVVLNLRNASGYSAKLEGSALVLVLDAAPAAAQAPGEPVHFAQSLNAAPQALRDIDFRRGADGAGRVIVNLPSNQVGVDIQQQGQNLVIEFLRSSLPENLRRKIDVVDFGTPVQMITTTQTGDRVRMLVEPRGSWEHSAYQSDNQFVLEVRPQKIDPNKLTQGPGYAGDKLSLNFQNIEVRALLQVIADFTNFNVVTSDTVTGSVTLRLKDVPWDQALDIIMQAKGLGLRKSGNVLWIAPKEELAAKEKLDLESKAAIAQLEPVRSQSFQLNYVKAEDIAKSLTGQASGSSSGGSGGGSTGGTGTRVLSARGNVFFEPRTNQLFVSDVASKLEEIQGMIAKIDIPVRQVLIEARIVEANDKFGRALGIKLGVNDVRGQQGGIPGYSVGGGNYVTVGGNYAGIGSQTNQGGTSNYNNTQFINLPANTSSDSFSNGNAATVALSLFSATANRFLNLELSALESDGKGKVVSSPRVITADQVKALIEQGEELPYQVATASGATSIAFRKANLKLEVTPQITPEGSVILNVDVNKDSRGTLTPQGYAINTKHVQTQVLVENGGTVVIGGIYTQDEGETVNKVPVLGDLPVVGNLFKNKTRTTAKTELLIFLTPKVVSERSTVR